MLKVASVAVVILVIVVLAITGIHHLFFGRQADPLSQITKELSYDADLADGTVASLKAKLADWQLESVFAEAANKQQAKKISQYDLLIKQLQKAVDETKDGLVVIGNIEPLKVATAKSLLIEAELKRKVLCIDLATAERKAALLKKRLPELEGRLARMQRNLAEQQVEKRISDSQNEIDKLNRTLDQILTEPTPDDELSAVPTAAEVEAAKQQELLDNIDRKLEKIMKSMSK